MPISWRPEWQWREQQENVDRHRINKWIFDDKHMIGQPMYFVLTLQPMISFHHLHPPVKLSDRRTNNSTNLSAHRRSYRPRVDANRRYWSSGLCFVWFHVCGMPCVLFVFSADDQHVKLSCNRLWMKIITHAEEEETNSMLLVGRFIGGREGGREGGNNCGVVLLVNIYYKLWKERHRTHIIMDNCWLMHNSLTSRRRRPSNIRNDFKALPRDTWAETPCINITPVNWSCVSCADAFRIATCSDSICRVRIRTHLIALMRLYLTIFCRIRMRHPYLWNPSWRM